MIEQMNLFGERDPFDELTERIVKVVRGKQGVQ